MMELGRPPQGESIWSATKEKVIYLVDTKLESAQLMMRPSEGLPQIISVTLHKHNEKTFL